MRRGELGFGPERRLRKRADFLRVQREGRAVRTPHFILLVAAGASVSGPARLGVVVTKKIGGAVVRNRIKRLCRECFRRDRSLVPAGIDLVAIAKTGAGHLGQQELDAEWGSAREKLHAQSRKVQGG